MARVMVMHALLLGVALALRETQATRAEVAMNFEEKGGKKYKLPRKCGKWSSSNCCSCGSQDSEIGDQQLDTQIDACKVEKGNTVTFPPCCPVWAVDCKEDEPEFKRGLERDCVVTKADCYEAQCHEPKATLDATLSALEALKGEEPKEETYEEQKLVTGTTSSKCCGCGDIVDPKSMTCEIVEKSWTCKKPKKCCSNLKDCKDADPWPQAVAARSKEVTAARSEHRKKLKQLKSEVADSKKILKDCMASCKVTQQKACVDDLKETASVTSGGWFKGDKSVSQQEMIMQDFYDKLLQRAETTQQERDELMQEAMQKERDRQKELNKKRNEKWRKETYGNLKNFVSGAAQSLSDAVRSKECCRCTMKKDLLTEVTDICSAKDGCAVYGGKCVSVPQSVCKDRRYTACPADHTYYVRGGDGEPY